MLSAPSGMWCWLALIQTQTPESLVMMRFRNCSVQIWLDESNAAEDDFKQYNEHLSHCMQRLRSQTVPQIGMHRKAKTTGTKS